MSAAYDIFCSYRHLDRQAVDPIVEALEGRGMRVWIDRSRIEDFASITRAIEHGLRRSKALLAYYSREYPRSRACQWELTTAFLCAQWGNDSENRVLIVNPERDVSHIAPLQLQDTLLRPVPYTGDPQAIEQLAASIVRQVAKLSGALGENCNVKHSRWYGWKPAGSTRFVGRLRDMWEIHSHLHRSDYVIIAGAGHTHTDIAQICGLGGIGKTLLAEEYALRFSAAYPGGVFWLRAYGNDDAKAPLQTEECEAARTAQIRDFAIAMGVHVQDMDPIAIEAALTNAIDSQGLPCLWIVDDLASGLDADSVRRWFSPHPLAKTLVTTRSQRYGALARTYDLGVLTEADAYELLTVRVTPKQSAEIEAARLLIGDLGGHALAVDVAGAIVANSPALHVFNWFREQLAKQDADFLELADALGDVLPTGRTANIAKTLLFSINAIGDEGQDLLRLTSVLATAPIPDSIALSVLISVDGIDEDEAAARVTIGLAQLRSYSLVEHVEEDIRWIVVHPLVTRSMRFHDQNPERTNALRADARAIFVHVMSESPSLHPSWKTALAHALELTRDSDETIAGELQLRIAAHYLARGIYESAREAARLAEEIFRRRLGAKSALAVDARNLLASVMQAQGKLKEAREVYESLLEQIRSEPVQHRMMLAVIGGLGETLRLLADFSGSQSLAREALEGCRLYFGGEDHQTIRSMNNLALTLNAMGQYREAKALQEEVLHIRVRDLSDTHPDTLRAKGNLAFTLYYLNELEAAEQMERDVLAGDQACLGENHPQTLTVMKNLAVTLYRRGKLIEAHDLSQRSFELHSLVLGKQHPRTAEAACNFAVLLRDPRNAKADLAMSRVLLEKALQIYNQEFGHTHPTTTEVAMALFLALTADAEVAVGRRVFREYIVWILRCDLDTLSPTQRNIRNMLLRMPDPAPKDQVHGQQASKQPKYHTPCPCGSGKKYGRCCGR